MGNIKTIKTSLLILITLALFACKDIRKEYYEDGTLKNELDCKNEDCSTTYAKYYYPNGVLQQEGNWINAKQENWKQKRTLKMASKKGS